jgi:DNA polymerase
MEKSVRRDAHKMKAFVRFRTVTGREGEGDHYVAWHRPDHLIVPLVATFFRDRFGVMRWTILTPDASVAWDGSDLTFGPGVPQREAPQPDDLEAMWKTYYASVFNPARIKLSAMRAEMPKKHWPTLPETEIIDDLLRDAPRRVEEMMNRQRRNAKPAAAGMTPDRSGTVGEGVPPTTPARSARARPSSSPSRGR